MEKVFRKVKCSESLPPLDVFVPTVDDHGGILIYRRVLTEYYLDGVFNEWAWSLRDLSTENTPHDNYKIEYWLQEVTIDELLTTSSRLKYLVDVAQLVQQPLDQHPESSQDVHD